MIKENYTRKELEELCLSSYKEGQKSSLLVIKDSVNKLFKDIEQIFKDIPK